ncbi:hypothetical protein ACE1TI_16215 [Alteribacillus sp. JSM 102045]|uniref:hypothetical protein n=1 Tax=Alteribacillus sp. JSM 102045 TaxID=1562101 RepID=UPI0035BF2D0A
MKTMTLEVMGLKTQLNIMISILIFTLLMGRPLVINAKEPQELQGFSYSPFEYIVREQYYGDMLPWEDVRSLLPHKVKFQVIDLDTGLSFRVQKRAGNQHADVQPLTRKDTQIMKEIYGNSWSWKRRAILVNTNDRMIAASMHGMPHGGGGLSNGFPGHFCIHFAGSITHRTKNSDPTHRLMVLKASGKLAEYRNEMNPYEIIDLFITAINQSDPYMLQMTLSEPHTLQMAAILKRMDRMGMVSKHTSFKKLKKLPIVALEVPVELQSYQRDQGKERKSYTFILTRDVITNRWEILSEDFLNLM